MEQNRCPRCGQPLVLGRCGICGWHAELAAAPAAEAPAAPATETPATETPATESPAAAPRGQVAPVEPAVVETRTAPAVVSGRPSEAQHSPLVVGMIVAIVVVALIALYAVVTLTGVRSDVRSLRSDQQSASDRLAQIEGELAVASSQESDLRSQLDAQRAADPVVLASEVQPSVFTIETPGGLGSGWVAASSGGTSSLVTNYHVVADVIADGTNTVSVYNDAQTKLTGTVQAASEAADVALIVVPGQLKPLKVSSQPVAPGQPVLVIGSPLGLGGSVTTGSVSALRNDFIQFSAPVSPGNSGGPVVNQSGEVVGVTEAKAVGVGVEGIAIAVPIGRVCSELRVAC